MAFDKMDRTKAQEQVGRWNANHPLVTKVTVKGYQDIKVTRTAAVLLFDRKPVIYLEGHNGYFDLDDVAPADSASAGVTAVPSAAGEAKPAPVQSNLCYMLPGQGSQKKGMGEALFDAFPDVVVIADKILGYSIKDLCLTDAAGVLGQTQYTQPALYVVNVLSYLNAVEKNGIKPAFVLGHSVGEYSALFAAGVFDFETGLRLVQKRGALMAEARGGGMAAVIGMDAARVRQVLRDGGLDTIDLANLNSPVQTVVAGPKADIDRARETFEAAGARLYLPLDVSGAFHSRYMRESQEAFRTFLDGFQFAEPSLTVISNVEARPYEARRAKSLLVDQLTSPVRWTESIGYLQQQGVETFVETGPGNVLGGLVAAITMGSGERAPKKINSHTAG